MAQTPRTYNEYTGNGSTVVFGFSFPYQHQGEVFVEVDGVPAPFTFDTSNTVRLDTAPGVGEIVRILRSTEADTMLYQFQLDAPFLPEYVDANNEQILYALQETNDDLRDVDFRISDAVAVETAARIAADVAEAGVRASEDASIRAEFAAADAALEAGYQAGDANLQAQIAGLADVPATERPIIQWHGQTLDNSVAIPANMNAFSAGPTVGISPGQSVTIGEGSFWTVMNGQAAGAVDEGTL